MLASCCVLFKEAVTGLGSCVPQKQDPKLLAKAGESSPLFFSPSSLRVPHFLSNCGDLRWLELGFVIHQTKIY